MKRVFLLFSVILVFLMAGSCDADSLGVVWLIIDQLSLDELITAETPNIDYLQNQGAFGLMNVRTAGHLQTESTYLSAGSGNRCQGSYLSHNGEKDGNGARNDRILELQELNQQTEYGAQIGRLGEIAAREEIKIGVIGNTDTLAGEKKTILTMVMDGKGFVPRAEIGSEVLIKTDREEEPWGFRTDWEQVKKAFREFKESCQFIVIESGDLSRIEDYRDMVGPESLREQKQLALERIDAFLGAILEEIDLKESRLEIIIPTPPAAAIQEGKQLSFLLAAGRGVKGSWLSSTTTRRKGLITISDLLALFLEGSGKSQGQISYLAEAAEWEELQDLNDNISLISRSRTIFVKGFIIAQLVLIVLSIGKFLYKKLMYSSIFQKIYEYLLLALLAVPLNYLIISNSRASSFWQLLVYLIIITVAAVFVLIKFTGSRRGRMMAVTGLLNLLIIYDLLNGSRLMADSLLGYSSIIGARYYGIGNEYMGLFIGSMLVFAASLLELKMEYHNRSLFSNYPPGTELLLILLFLLTAYFTGAPGLGANFGGTVTALVVGSVSYFHLYKTNTKEPKKQTGVISALIVCSVLLMSGIIYLNYSSLTAHTHIGRAVGFLINGEWSEICKIIIRKLNMNIKLLKWTIWSRALLASIILLVFLFKHPGPVLKGFLNKRYLLAGAFYGALFGSIISMFVNDSGVVAAATLLFYPLLALLYFLESREYKPAISVNNNGERG